MITPAEHIDMETLAELKEVMEDEFQILIDTFLSDSQKRLSAIKAALESASADDLRSAAHSFKGSSSNIGAPLLAEHLKKLEEMGRVGDLTGAPNSLKLVEAEYQAVQQSLRKLVN